MEPVCAVYIGHVWQGTIPVSETMFKLSAEPFLIVALIGEVSCNHAGSAIQSCKPTAYEFDVTKGKCPMLAVIMGIKRGKNLRRGTICFVFNQAKHHLFTFQEKRITAGLRCDDEFVTVGHSSTNYKFQTGKLIGTNWAY